MSTARPQRSLHRQSLRAAHRALRGGLCVGLCLCAPFVAAAAHTVPPASATQEERADTDAASLSPSQRAARSTLATRYASPRTTELLARIERLEKDRTPGALKRLAEAERELSVRAMRTLVEDGLRIPSRNGITAARRQALETIQSLSSPLELGAATHVLEGEGMRPNLVNGEFDVRSALFTALAREPRFGHPTLVGYAIAGEGAVALLARDSLPEELSPEALAVLEKGLRSSRELHINRAAMVASAHASAALIPALIDAQFSERPTEARGDEAWIAIGQRTAYVAGYVPVLGGGSGALQPIPGIVYEGSLLRIMESAVTIYRTEVHRGLAMVIERSTGEPAPPLGYDRERWLAWYRNDYPVLAQAYAEELSEQRRAESDTVTIPARGDA